MILWPIHLRVCHLNYATNRCTNRLQCLFTGCLINRAVGPQCRTPSHRLIQWSRICCAQEKDRKQKTEHKTERPVKWEWRINRNSLAWLQSALCQSQTPFGEMLLKKILCRRVDTLFITALFLMLSAWHSSASPSLSLGIHHICWVLFEFNNHFINDLMG